MALPVAPGPRSTDVAVTDWAGITARVAWTLLAEGVKVRPAVLRDARDHVLYHLDPATPAPQAEDRAAILTRRFVAQARRRKNRERWPLDAEMPLSPRWHRALQRSMTPVTATVFRQHFGDERPLEVLEARLDADRIALDAARGGLREVVRRAGCGDGLPLDSWPNERIDALLRRLAAFAPGPCPPIEVVLGGDEGPHVVGCPRCARMVRLIKAGVLDLDALRPPPGAARPGHHVHVLALHFHPDGRHHRARLLKRLEVPAFPIGEDLLVVDWSDHPAIATVVRQAAQLRAPHRDHVRGVVLDGPGRWARHTLLGPVPDRAAHAVSSRSWGTVDTLGELPEPLPEPPSARRWWAAAAGLTALATLTVALTTRPAVPAAHGLDVEFAEGRGGVWTNLDLDDTSHLTLVRADHGGLDVVVASRTPADKAEFALGDGRYLLHTMGSAVLVAATADPLADLEPMLAAAEATDDPLTDLATRITTAHPGAAVQLHHAR